MEFDSNAFITLELYEVTSEIHSSFEKNEVIKPNYILTKECIVEIPIVFQFEDLKENTKYLVHLKSQVYHAHPRLADLECSFKTLNSFKKSNNISRIVFISCNSNKFRRKFIPEEYNLWRDLSERIEKGEVDYCIHIGDQVYLDDGKWDKDEENCVDRCLALWKESYRDIKEIKKKKLAEEEELLKNDNAWQLEKQSLSKAFIKIISEENRNTYSSYSQAKVLRRVPNLMILDDHDVFDNFSFHDSEIYKFNSFEHFLSEQARFCFYKYQKFLQEDIDFFQDFNKNIIYEHSFHLVNGIGIFIQDFRGCRSWSRLYKKIELLGNKEFFLGKKQQEDIIACFGPGGYFETTKAAVYASSTPMVFLSKGPAKLGVKRKIEDCIEQWPLTSPNDQTWILDILNNFRERTNKNIFIVSGDPHIGVFTKIYKNRQFVLYQVVSTAITQKPPTPVEFEAMRLMLNISKRLKNGYTMKHHKETNDNNYIIVEFRPEYFDLNDPLISHRFGIFCKHIRSNRKRIKEDEFLNIGFRFEKDRGSHCGCHGCKIN